MFKNIKNLIGLKQNIKSGQTQGADDRLKALRKDPHAPLNFGVPIVNSLADENKAEVDVHINDVIGFWYITEQKISDAIPADTKKINLYINSPGGEVWEGLAIYDYFVRHPAEVNVRVTGWAASMASIIAMAGDIITVPPAMFLMIHNPYTWMVGEADDLEKEAELLRKMEAGMAGIYAARTGQKIETIRKWMKDTTYFSGEEAVDYGFADQIQEVADATAYQGMFNLGFLDPKNKNNNHVATAMPNNIYNNNNEETDKMNEKLRKMLEAKGLNKNATEDEAWAFLNTLNSQPAVNVEEVQAGAVKMEQDRQKEIRTICQISCVGEDFAEKLISGNYGIEAAREKVFHEMARINPAVGAGRIETGRTEGEKFQAAARDGLLMRAGMRLDKPEPGAGDFRGFEMTSIVRESLRRSGADVSHLNSRRAVADYVFNQRAGMLTTSDFPAIFRDVAHKTLLKSYAEAPATWVPWVNIVPASDFKTIYGISLSEAPDLDLVPQGTEYNYGALHDNQEAYQVYKYGKIIKLTFEMLVNDELRAFTRLPQLLGSAARRKEADLVYGLLTSGSNSHGPTMTDTYQLFKATNHNNLLQTGRSVTAANVDAAIQLMGAQTGPNGANLDIQPRFFLAGPKNNLASKILFNSASHVDDHKSAGVINPMQGAMEAIIENRLGTVFSGLGWYLIGDPAQFDTFEVAYLEGYEQPQISEREGFTADTIEWKVRQFFGVGAMAYRSMVLNDGTA